MAHEYFKEKRLFGEWFKADFKEAVDVVKSLHEKFSRFSEAKQEVDATETIKLIFGNMPFEGNYKFSDEFIEMAIELGEKMKEIKMLKEEIKRNKEKQ